MAFNINLSRANYDTQRAINYYEVLRLSDAASLEMITDSFRLRVIEAHPARHNQSFQEYLEVLEAYHTLRDFTRRTEYDRSRIRQPLDRATLDQLTRELSAEWEPYIEETVAQENRGSSGAAWLATGAMGGVALGATIGGPVGAVAGAIVGIAAGGVRAATGKSMLDHWNNLSPQEQRAMLENIFTVTAKDGSREGEAAAGGAQQARLSEEEVRAITDGEPEEDGIPLCKICLENMVKLAIHPCGHTCLCAGCYLQLGPRKTCPMCRMPIQKVTKVFF